MEAGFYWARSILDGEARPMRLSPPTVVYYTTNGWVWPTCYDSSNAEPHAEWIIHPAKLEPLADNYS